MLAALGVVVLVVAILALRSPHDSSTSAGTTTRSASESAPSTSSTGSSSTRGTASASSGRASKSTAQSAARSTASTSGTAQTRRGALPLIVLNASGTAGLADVAKKQFASGGWRVNDTDDNYVNRIISTAAYYDPAVPNAQAVALALQQQFPTIKRVVPKFVGLPDGPIVVVLTAGYSSA